MDFETMYNESERIYNEEYSTGEYCHEQSFKWGFQEGFQFSNKKMIEKACECLIKFHNWPTQYEEYATLQEEFIKEFRKAMEE